MVQVSENIVIDLTKCLANVGEKVPFGGDFVLGGDLLSYPDATLEKVSVSFDVTFLNPDVLVEGTVQCFLKGKCDRCQENVEKSVTLPFRQIFCKDFAPEDGYAYTASRLDATKAVQDEIVLGLPTLFLCDDNCKGLCPKCGADLNKGDCGCAKNRENVFSVLKNLKF